MRSANSMGVAPRYVVAKAIKAETGHTKIIEGWESGDAENKKVVAN